MVKGGRKKRLGDMLLESNVINENQLYEALDYQKKHGIKLGQALVDLGYLTEESKTDFLSKQLRLDRVDLKEVKFDSSLIKLFDKQELKELGFIPYEKTDISIKVIVSDPFNITLDDFIRDRTGYTVEYVLAKDSELEEWLDSFVGYSGIEKALLDTQDNVEVDDEFDLNDDMDSPVIELINKILVDAVDLGASDIHIMPSESNVNIRYRIDGVLQQIQDLPKNLRYKIVARIKTMSGIDIAERRKPQGGKIKATIAGRYIDMRVSTLPCVYGEKITIRVLDKDSFDLNINELGFSKINLDNFKKTISFPYGIFLITGPTGSGKSTTLYSVISELNDVTKNIVTLEDPVEYNMSSVTQVQVNNKAGLTFASGFREILRQDPDIIMVGEIRDEETARTAVQASNTGHLVLSTLHTNDSTSALVRLLDMGLEPYMITGSLIAVLSQRLVRRVCPHCKEEYMLPEGDSGRALLGVSDNEPVKLYRGKGCDVCHNIGYSGRVAVQELLLVDDILRDSIKKDTTSTEVRELAVSMGLKTLQDDGIDKVLKGITTIEEIKRMIAF